MKIIQVILTPDNATFQSVILGLGDDSSIYEACNDAVKGNWWKPYFKICDHCDGKGEFTAWNELKGNFIETCDCPAGKSIQAAKATS